MSNLEKTVYLIRHGQSEDNVAPVFQSPDSPLNEKGKNQAGKIAERIKNIDHDVLISSPFRRTKETALIISRATGKEPLYSDLFTERRKPSSVNGKSHEDKMAAEIFERWNDSLSNHNLRVGDGENFQDITERADKALAFLEERTEKSLVVVTHGFFLRVLAMRVLLGDFLSPEIMKSFCKATSTENTGLTVLKYKKDPTNPDWRLWIYNDHAHLG